MPEKKTKNTDVQIQFGKKMLELRQKKRVSQADVAEYLNLTVAAYQNYENGRREASYETISKLADYYGVSTDYLLGRDKAPDPITQLTSNTLEQVVIDEYFKLPPQVRAQILEAMVEAVKRKMTADATEEEIQVEVNKIVLTFFDDAASAGPGEVLGAGEHSTIEVLETETALEADCVIRVSGDSMEDTFHDGDLVLVKYTSDLEYGDIGIFVLNNDGYIKEYGEKGLISHNEKYPLIEVSGSDECQVVGKVLDIAEKA